MVIETALPFCLCKSKIHFFLRWSCYFAFINYVINLTVPFHWTFCFFSAFAFRSLVTWFRCDIFIMSLNDFQHIVHTTVAYVNCIAIENFVKFLSSWKMFCYQLKNVFATFVETESLKRGLNHTMFRFRVFSFSDLLLVCFKSTL